MIFHHVRNALFLLVVLLGLSITSSASANFVATGKDAARDATDADPGRDIVRVGFSYDRRTGEMRGGVRLRGAPNPAAPANLTVFAGRRTATGCNGYPAIGFATQTDMDSASWVILRSPDGMADTGYAEKTIGGAAEDYQATAWSLRGFRPNCVIASLNEPGTADNVYDVAGPYVLRGLAELEVKINRVPPTLRPDRPRRLRAVLRNVGDGPTGRVRLAVRGVRGLKARLPRAVKNIRPGTRRVVTLRVTLNRRARNITPLRLTARARNGVRAVVNEKLPRYRAPGRGGGGGGGTGGGGEGGSQLCFRYTWLPPYSELVPC